MVETLDRFKRLYLAMLPGIVCGIWLLVWVDQGIATRVLGLVMISYVALALARPAMAIPQRLQSVLQYPTGFLNGVVTGVTGAQVMPLFPYIMGLQMDPSRTVQAINLAVLIASTVLGVGLVAAGIMTRDTLRLSSQRGRPWQIHHGQVHFRPKQFHPRRVLPDRFQL